MGGANDPANPSLGAGVLAGLSVSGDGVGETVLFRATGAAHLSADEEEAEDGGGDE